MKTQHALVVAAFLLLATHANADLTMYVLRETYHAWGYVEHGDYTYDWGGGWVDEYPANSKSYDYTVSYDYAQGDAWPVQPGVSGAVSIPIPPYPYQPGWVSSFYASSSTSRYQSGDSVSFHTEAYSTRFGPSGTTPPYSWDRFAGASIEVEFMLGGLADQLYVTVDGYFMYSVGSARLMAGDEIWSLYSGMGSGSFAWWDNPDPIPIDTAQV